LVGSVTANSKRWFTRAGAATQGTTAVTFAGTVNHAATVVVAGVVGTGVTDVCGTTDTVDEVLDAARCASEHDAMSSATAVIPATVRRTRMARSVHLLTIAVQRPIARYVRFAQVVISG
jgi:hypothetical protein